MAFDPAISVEVSDLTIDRSADVATGVVTDDVLFAALGSLLVEVTVAVLTIEPVALDGTVKVDVNVTLEPAGIVPSEQGNGVVHAPLFETNVTPAGGVSLTVTPVASDGPAVFDTVML